jgi:hypothetical protein
MASVFVLMTSLASAGQTTGPVPAGRVTDFIETLRRASLEQKLAAVMELKTFDLEASDVRLHDALVEEFHRAVSEDVDQIQTGRFQIQRSVRSPDGSNADYLAHLRDASLATKDPKTIRDAVLIDMDSGVTLSYVRPTPAEAIIEVFWDDAVDGIAEALSRPTPQGYSPRYKALLIEGLLHMFVMPPVRANGLTSRRQQALVDICTSTFQGGHPWPEVVDCLKLSDELGDKGLFEMAGQIAGSPERVGTLAAGDTNGAAQIEAAARSVAAHRVILR